LFEEISMLKTLLRIGLGLLLMMGLVPALAQERASLPATCASGLEFENGAEVHILLRPGTYTATVLGKDDFNPQLAVYTRDTNEELGCNADEPAAAAYTLELPTTGVIEASSNTAQVTIRVGGADFQFVSFFVSDEANSGGEFVLVFETLTITSSDNQGDFVVIPALESLTGSDVPITAYMIGIDDNIDPLIYVGSSTFKPITRQLNDQLVECNDAGNLSCYGETDPLDTSTITSSRNIAGDLSDATLTLTWDEVAEVDTRLNNLILLMASFLPYDTSFMGEYVIAFHMGISE
jgi:hypothetical protein